MFLSLVISGDYYCDHVFLLYCCSAIKQIDITGCNETTQISVEQIGSEKHCDTT